MASAFDSYQLAMGRLEHKANVACGSVGRSCATHPCKTILISFVVAFGFMAGFVRISRDSSSSLWVDPNCEAQKNNDWVETVYPDFASSSKLLITAKDGGSVLRQDMFVEVFELKKEVDKLIGKDADGKDCATEDACMKNPLDECVMTGALGFFENDKAVFENMVSSDADVLSAVNVDTWPKYGGTVNHDQVFGKLEEDASDKVTSAKAMRVNWLNSGDCRKPWEEEFLNLLMGDQRQTVTKKFEHLVVQVQVGKSGTDELDRNVSGDILIFALSYITMIIVATFVLGRPCHCVRLRASLAGCDVGLILLSIGAGYGFSFICGIPFNLLAQILPFILLGVGIDDSFVIAAALDATDESLPIPERMGQALERVGTSIVFTSLTDIIAFGLGYTSRLPAIQYFCFMGMAAIAFIFFFHMTWFVAMLTLDTRRQLSQRADCCCCAKPGCNSEAKKDGFARRAVRKYGEVLIGSFIIRVGVLVVFFGVFILSLWAMATQTKTGFDLMDITPDNSYLRNMYLAEEELYGVRSSDDNIPAIVYFRGVDVSKPAVQAEMLAVAEDLHELEMIDNELEVSFWLKEWRKFAVEMRTYSHVFGEDRPEVNMKMESVCATGEKQCGEYFTGPDFERSVLDWLNTSYVVNTETGKMTFGGQRFENDVIFTDAGQIETCRMYAFHVDMSGSLDQIKGMTQTEDFYRERDTILPQIIIVSGYYPLYDQYRIIVMEILGTFIMCVGAVLVLAIFVLIHPASVFIALLTLCMIFVDLFAAVSMWGLEVNSLTGICLICSIGLVVDYTAHICHSFSVQDANLNRCDRVIETIAEMGLPVGQGAFTTLVAVLPLSLASSESFRIFFRMFTSMVVVGATHGLIFAPVVLSFIGPTLLRPHQEKPVEPPPVDKGDAAAGEEEPQKPPDAGLSQEEVQPSVDITAEGAAGSDDQGAGKDAAPAAPEPESHDREFVLKRNDWSMESSIPEEAPRTSPRPFPSRHPWNDIPDEVWRP